MKTVQGFVLIDVDVAALNNAGKDTTTHLENAVATKKIYKAGKGYAYVSGQAWRYWWRETLQKYFNWEMSPIVREAKIAFTEANPIKYPDDDMFGYMRAAKEEFIDSKGKKKSENVTLTRISPLKNSALMSVSPTHVVKHFSVMSRQEGDTVPYGKDEYCAIMKGMFSISIDQVGTFSSQNRSGYKNLNETLKELAKKKGAEEINDPFEKDKNGNPLKLFQLPKELRFKRIKDALQSLEIINGGAMQTSNMSDVTPKMIVLTTLESGNHPFSHIASDYLGKPVFSIDALKQVVKDCGKRICGKVYIGRRIGFMNDLEEQLQKLTQDKDNEKFFYGSINDAIKAYVDEINVMLSKET